MWRLRRFSFCCRHVFFTSAAKIDLTREDSNVYLSWGKVFKAPTIDQLYYGKFDNMPSSNPNLKAEKGDVWTLGGIQFLSVASVSGTDTKIASEATTQIAVQYTVTHL